MTDTRNLAAVEVATDLLSSINARLIEHCALVAQAEAGKVSMATILASADAIDQAVADRQAEIEAVIAANVPAHEWDGTALALRNPDGTLGTAVDLVGPQGPVRGLVITSITTLPAGSAATVTVDPTSTATELRIALGLPRGNTGDTGQPGDTLRGVETEAGASYTLELADIGKLKEIDHTEAATVTVPPDADVAWPDDCLIHLLQVGEGAFTIAPGDGPNLMRECFARTGSECVPNGPFFD